MSELAATVVFATIMGIGAIVWLVAVHLTRRIGKYSSNLHGASWCEDGLGINTGEVVCDASKEELMQRIPHLLRRQSLRAVNSLFKVVEQTDNELVVQRVGPVVCNLPIALYFSRVHFRLEPRLANSTLVRYSIDQSDMSKLMRGYAANLLFMVAFPMMVGIGLLVWCIVIPSQNLAIRGQVFQTIHIVHAIWPAFMFICIAAAARRSTKIFMERVLMVASDPELMELSDELLPCRTAPIRTSPNAFPS